MYEGVVTNLVLGAVGFVRSAQIRTVSVVDPMAPFPRQVSVPRRKSMQENIPLYLMRICTAALVAISGVENMSLILHSFRVENGTQDTD